MAFFEDKFGNKKTKIEITLRKGSIDKFFG